LDFPFGQLLGTILFFEDDNERVELTAVNRRGLRFILAQPTRPGETLVARHGYACDSPLLPFTTFFFFLPPPR
jgi:hypothetical protein